MKKDTFDQMAEKYDSEERKQLADIIAEEIKQTLDGYNYHSMMDYGGGTGLVTFQLSDYFESGWLVDASEEMLQIAGHKIKQQHIDHFDTIHSNLADRDTLNIKTDVIILSLVLLHVPNFETLIKNLYTHLNFGGMLIIIDFDKNENIHHPKVHNGFTREEMHTSLHRAGFRHITMKTFHHGQHIFMKQDASLFISTSTK